MKHLLLLSLGLSGLLAFGAVPARSAEPELRYIDAQTLPVYGKVRPETSGHYTRLPAYMQEGARKSVWRLGLSSAGLYLRFRTDSRSIKVRWTSGSHKEMRNMAAPGARGLDLYARWGGSWRYCATGVPSVDSDESEYDIGRNLNGEMREYMLYLSLYNQVLKLEIGIEPDAVFEASDDPHPAHEKPVVMYGTSILQGGCASRPGMAFTNILSRRLDREVVNLGFSGNALLDEDVARWMASCPDPSVFVLDNMPNGGPKLTLEKEENFYRILREAHPNVPVVFVECLHYPGALFNQGRAKSFKGKNEALRQVYDGLVAKGEKNIYYVSADNLIGDDGEATVDGTHFTDIGMVRYADVLEPVLRSLL